MSETYSGAASDGLMDGVDFAPNTTGADYGGGTSMTPTHVRLAWGIIMVALALLWFLGAVVFRVAIR